MSGTATARHKRISQDDSQEANFFEANHTLTSHEIMEQLKMHTHLRQDKKVTIIGNFIKLHVSILSKHQMTK
jgi:hypothetical protein